MDGLLSNLFTALIGAVIGYAFGATKVYIENFQDRKFSVLFGEEYAKYHEAITFLLLPEDDPASRQQGHGKERVLVTDYRRALEERVKTYNTRYDSDLKNDAFAQLDRARRVVDLYINKVENVVMDSQSWLVRVMCCTCRKPNGLYEKEEEKVARVYFRYSTTVINMYAVFYEDSEGNPKTPPNEWGPNKNKAFSFPECKRIYDLWKLKHQNSATQARSTKKKN